MSQRTDIHRPGVLVPEDYTCILVFSAGDAELLLPPFNKAEALDIYVGQLRGAQIHGGIFACDVCGAHYRDGALFEHKYGEVISVGHDCAEKLELMADWGPVEMNKGAGLRAREAAEREAGLAAWDAENVAMAEMLKLEHPIVRDIRERLRRTGGRFGLSEKQEALVRKLWDEANAPPKARVPVPWNGMRVMLEGVVVGLRSAESQYGITLKMTLEVASPDGIGTWLCYGTVPAALLTAGAALGGEGGLRGKRVRFKATVVPGDREPHFGFFSRPNGGEIL